MGLNIYGDPKIRKKSEKKSKNVKKSLTFDLIHDIIILYKQILMKGN